jgi:hypothetical protein
LWRKEGRGRRIVQHGRKDEGLSREREREGRITRDIMKSSLFSSINYLRVFYLQAQLDGKKIFFIVYPYPTRNALQGSPEKSKFYIFPHYFIS